MASVSKSVVGAAVAALFAVGGVQASTVEGTLFGGLNQLSDNSAEALIDMNGSTVGVVDVGDRLRGIFTIETVEPISAGGATRNLGAGSTNYELTGLFDITIAAKFLTPANPANPLSKPVYTFVFAPTAGFAAEIGGPTGSMIAFYQDPTPDYSRLIPNCTTKGAGGDCEALVSGNDATLLWVAGFDGLNSDEFWVADTNTDNIGTIGGAGSATNGGTFNIGLDLLKTNGNRTLLTVDCGFPSGPTQLEFCGSGSLLGKGTTSTPYDSFNNVDFQINVVPEPASLALTGLALLGLGVASRRRKN